MLQPARTKYRKQQKGRMKGLAHRGSDIAFGSFAIQATERGWLTARQIEAARIAITRHIKRHGRVWIRVFPDKPVCKKPLETRMGKGKGAPDHYVAVIKPGRILYELDGVDIELAREALRRAGHKLPLKTRMMSRSGGDLKMANPKAKSGELRAQSNEELSTFITTKTDELLRLRFQYATGQLENVRRVGQVRREIARAKTIATARSKGLESAPGTSAGQG